MRRGPGLGTGSAWHPTMKEKQFPSGIPAQGVTTWDISPTDPPEARRIAADSPPHAPCLHVSRHRVEQRGWHRRRLTLNALGNTAATKWFGLSALPHPR
jgi:hypothetical protein